MKELSIEEKAKAYDEAIERAKAYHNDYTNDIIEEIFPELKESEDENIRKGIIRCLIGNMPDNSFRKKYIAWLEKQGEQDNDEDVDILHRFSFYSYKDEPNVLYLSGLYVNEECRNKGIGTKILEVADEVAKSLNCRAIRLKTKKGSNAERLYRTHGYNSLTTGKSYEIWLEKQGEQKPADKVEPKFHEGDWVIGRSTDNEPRQIAEITEEGYRTTYGGWIGFSFEEDLRLWTIQDAKAGDVLFVKGSYFKEYTFIYSGMTEDNVMSTYCGFDMVRNIFDTKLSRFGRMEDFEAVFPATKEQRDLLFQKMKEAGYEWDAEKKKLKKIENKNPLLSDFFKDEYERGKADAQKSAWSEEDEEKIKFIEEELSCIIADEKEVETPLNNRCKTLYSALFWLKSLRSHKYVYLYECIKECDGFKVGNIYKSDGEWVYGDNKKCAYDERFFRSQNHWKPSDKQISALEWQTNNTYQGSWQYEASKKLLEQLKKLREE